MKLRQKFVKLPWQSELNKVPKLFWMCHKKIHQEHPQIDRSYIGKIKIFQVRFGHVTQSANNISYDSIQI